MLDNKNRRSDRSRIRGATWLALVSLAWLQLTLTSHQFDHVAEYFADSCHVCVQLDRTDDLTADLQVVPASSPFADAGPSATVTASPGPAIVTGYSSRAPPQL